METIESLIEKARPAAQESVNKVKVEVRATNCFFRRGCDLGGLNEKEDVVCEVFEGPHKGFSVSPYYFHEEHDVDADLEEAAISAEKRASDNIKYAAELRSLKGRLILPTPEEFAVARRAATEERRLAVLRAAEGRLSRLLKDSAPAQDVSYARIAIATERQRLANYGEDYIVVPSGIGTDFDPGPIWGDLNTWVGDDDIKSGVPVSMWIEDIGNDRDGFLVSFEILKPLKELLVPRRIDRTELAKLCRAAGVSDIPASGDAIRYRPFTALMDDDANIVKLFYADKDDAPEIPVAPKPKIPWGH